MSASLSEAEVRTALRNAPLPPGTRVVIERIEPLPGGGYRVVLRVE